jgi:hypothetical protein
MKPSLPLTPPCREYRSIFGCDLLVNEYKTVDWYTQLGKLFDESQLVTKIPKFWLFRLFMRKDQIQLEHSLRVNRDMCRKLPRI